VEYLLGAADAMDIADSSPDGVAHGRRFSIAGMEGDASAFTALTPTGNVP
jgi:hypothetical protein